MALAEEATSFSQSRSLATRPSDDQLVVFIGRRIKMRRIVIGLTQARLAEMIGTSHQSIQKYESGSVRISAPSLWLIASALSVPISYFFDGAQGDHHNPGADAGSSDGK